MRYIICLACFFMMLRAPAQNIVAAEYFFDNDPGTGAGNPITITTPGTIVQFSTAVPTAALSPGFHTLAIRTRDAGNQWSLFETRAFYISSVASSPGQLIAAEYFIDTDPGTGNGVPLAIGPAGNVINFTANIPTASLGSGFHFLAIRTRSADGHWSLFEARGFYTSANTANAGAITAAEYFIDADPGVGNGNPTSIGASGNTVNFTASIPTTALTPGFHTLAIRTRNVDGTWGLFEVRPFYISTSSANATPIVAAEFFIDADPGPGNGTPVAIGPNGNTVNFTASIPTASLSTGFHTLAIRTRNSNGEWGLFETRPFYISTQAANMGIVSAAEYFIDTDPGVGNGTALTVTSPGNIINQSFIVNVPVGMPLGTHLLAIRTRDAAGVWGLFEYSEFTVTGSVLPLDWISFTAQKADKKVVLKWVTENEVNTDYFQVERSTNGVDFTTIGKVAAMGNAHNSYDFEDLQPATGLNFYRLKQFDKNGAAKYSTIIKIHFGDASLRTLRLYPNPAKDQLTIAFSGRESLVTIQVFDAAGKMVMNTRTANSPLLYLPVSSLANGSYWITVSDGLTLEKSRFIKSD